MLPLLDRGNSKCIPITKDWSAPQKENRGPERTCPGIKFNRTISKYELDKAMPSSEVLVALAVALGVSVDYLFGDPNLIMVAVEFRGNKLKSKRDIARIEAKVLHLSIGVF